MKKYHYVYEIKELSSGKMYIGCRSSDILPEEDIGVLYFSSSTDIDFRKSQKENPSNYSYRVLTTHSNRKSAALEEMRLHEQYDVANNEMYFNRCKATSDGFAYYGNDTCIVYDENGKKIRIKADDPRYLSRELESIFKDTVVVKDKDGNSFRVNVSDPRYLSGELVPRIKGTVVVKDKEGNMSRVDLTDSRYLSGELVHNMSGIVLGANKDMVIVKDSQGNTTRVTTDDNRYLSGELNHISIGMVVAKDKDGNIVHVDKKTFDESEDLVGHSQGNENLLTRNTVNVRDGNKVCKISKNDPRYNTTLFSSNIGKVQVKDKEGNYFQVSVDDHRYLSGELVHIFNGKAVVVDKDGNISQVDKDDPRIKLGELVSNAKGRRAITDGNSIKMIRETDELPTGWKYGRKL